MLAAFVAGVVVSRFNKARRRSPRERAERAATRALWMLAKRAPTRRLLRDPASGRYLGVDRRLSFLEVVVSDVDFTDERSDDSRTRW